MKPEHIPHRWRCQCVACRGFRSQYESQRRKARLEKRIMTTADVSKFSGATLRQLQWWDEKGWLKARIVKGQYGKTRIYTRSQAVRARKLREMKDAGLSAKNARTWLSKRWDRAVRIIKPQIVAGVLVIPDWRRQRSDAT